MVRQNKAGAKMKISEIIYESREENFKRWFRNSKIVDGNGRPLVVYHGANSDFSAFDPTHDVRGNGLIFFTPDREAAMAYGNRVVPVYLSVQKLFDAYSNFPNAVKSWIISNAKIIANEIFDYKQDFGLANHSYTDGEFDVEKYISAIASGEWQSVEASSSLIQHIRMSGYDGIKFFEDGDTYAIFSPNQIKSTTLNNGNFDPNNPDITKE